MNLIKFLREARVWSQDELAARAKMDKRTIQRLESNENEPTPDTIQRLAQALEVTPQILRVGTIDRMPTRASDRLVWLGLVAHADADGRASGIWSELKTWLGDSGATIDCHETVLRLRDDGFLAMGYTEYGADARFNVLLEL